MTNLGLHHIHKRKRKNTKIEEFPHPKAHKRFLDYLIYVASIMTPLVLVPQSWKIWINQNASEISLITFVGLTITNSIWIIYGFVHKERPIIVTYILLFIVNASIVLGTLLYR